MKKDKVMTINRSRLTTKDLANEYITNLQCHYNNIDSIIIKFENVVKITPSFANELFRYISTNYKSYEIIGLNAVQLEIVKMEIDCIKEN